MKGVYVIVKDYESEKFERIGGLFWLLLLGIGLVLPFLVSLVACIAQGALRLDVFLPFGLVMMVIAWVILAMLIGYGSLTSPFVKRTANSIQTFPYQFNGTFTGRGGKLYIDVEDGVIGFISAYNPTKFQIFSASRISDPKTIASTTSGIRFVFFLDGKKVSMPTLITNKIVSLKSGIGAEAVSKADAFVELLKAAKAQAEAGSRQ